MENKKDRKYRKEYLKYMGYSKYFFYICNWSLRKKGEIGEKVIFYN